MRRLIVFGSVRKAKDLKRLTITVNFQEQNLSTALSGKKNPARGPYLRACLHGGKAPQPSYSGKANFSYVSFENASKSLHATQGSPPTGTPCLLARGTRLSGLAFCHVNGSSRAIWANTAKTWRREVNIFVVTIYQCYLPNRMTVILNRSM